MAKLDDMRKACNEGQAARMRQENIERRDQQRQFEKKSNMQQQFMKGFVGKQPGKADGVKVPAKPAVPQETVQKQDSKTPQQTLKPHNAEQQAKAEKGFQEARGKLRALNEQILKAPKLDVQVKNPEAAPKKGAAEQAGKQAQAQAEQAGAKVADQAVKVAGQQPRPMVGKKAAQNAKLAQKKGGAQKQVAQRRGEVPEKKVAKVLEKGSEGAKGSTQGQVGIQVAAQAGTVQAGAKQGKAEGAKGAKVTKGEDKKSGKKGAKSVGSRPAYTGPSEARATTAQLGSLLGGEAGESPFDLQPDVTPTESVDYEPVEWNTGGETYTNIPSLAKSEQIRQAAVEHRQRTLQELIEKPNYENWDMSRKSIRELFIGESALVLRLTEQVIANMRLATGPAGKGHSC